MTKTYQEICAHRELVDYLEQRDKQRKSLWCELYRDCKYQVYFEPYNNEPQSPQRNLIDNL